MRAIVIAGQGLSAALPSQLQRELAEGLCVILPVTLPWLTLNYGFITKRSRTLSPPTRVFMDLMREVERELESGEDVRVIPKSIATHQPARKRMSR